MATHQRCHSPDIFKSFIKPQSMKIFSNSFFYPCRHFCRNSFLRSARLYPCSEMLIGMIIQCFQVSSWIYSNHSTTTDIFSLKFNWCKSFIIDSISCHQCKKSACRTTTRNNSKRIGFISYCIVLHPNNSSFYIVYHSHQVRFRSEPVCDIHNHMSLRRKMPEEWTGTTIFIKNIKCTACLLYTSDAADERSSVDLG